MKKCSKLIATILVTLILIGITTISKARVITDQELNAFAEEYSLNNVEHMTIEKVVDIYDKLTEKFTNEDIADTIDNSESELIKEGIDKDTVDTISVFLRTTDTKEMRKILQESDLQTLMDDIQNSNKSQNQLRPETINFIARIFMANNVVKVLMIISLAIAIYKIIIRWIIYKKAGKHGWAALIPIYRHVVWLKVAGLSPWLILLGLIPFIGWIALWIVFLISKFTLPGEFGKSGVWGLGIWLLPIIFLSIVAFSKEFQYKTREG